MVSTPRPCLTSVCRADIGLPQCSPASGARLPGLAVHGDAWVGGCAMPQARDHAVVLGASMAGLLTARVLADAYPKVTIIDRDDLAGIGVHRRGVPHARHHHALQPRGCAVLEELFPGFTAQIARAGAGVGDMLRHCRWLPYGHRLRQTEGGVLGVIA